MSADPLFEIIRRLNRIGLTYMLTGSYASNISGTAGQIGRGLSQGVGQINIGGGFAPPNDEAGMRQPPTACPQ